MIVSLGLYSIATQCMFHLGYVRRYLIVVTLAIIINVPYSGSVIWVAICAVCAIKLHTWELYKAWNLRISTCECSHGCIDGIFGIGYAVHKHRFRDLCMYRSSDSIEYPWPTYEWMYVWNVWCSSLIAKARKQCMFIVCEWMSISTFLHICLAVHTSQVW